MDTDTEACKVSKQGLSVLQRFNKSSSLKETQLIFCNTNWANRAWWKITFPQTTMTRRQELCLAQLNGPSRQSHIDIHLKEHQRRSYESVRAQCTRAKNPLRALTPQLSCSTSPLAMKGMWASWQGGSRLEVRVTTGHIRVTCQGWNPSAYPGQCPHPPHTWFSFLLLTSLTCLEWVQMCDPQTLQLGSPYWTHRAQQRLARSLKSSWPKCHRTQSDHLQAIVWRW